MRLEGGGGRGVKILGSTSKKLVNYVLKAASNEAGVYRLEAAGIYINLSLSFIREGGRQKRHQPHAVGRHHGARVALLRGPIGHNVEDMIREPAGGPKR